ncbi:MAG: right-handed parallel beta-helix repeat-containing protein [Verrucomicrobiales bacterium]|nr:right-handed parallel beta-helix repeat-containing protein [Verrucomicrobiales bacterium]
MKALRQVMWATVLGGAFHASAVEWHVSPTGSSQPDGSAARPFATLREAVAAMRKVRVGETRRIVVHGGDYFEAGCVLGPDDSGLTVQAAEEERPMLHGGRRITEWRTGENGWLSANLPPLSEGVDGVPGDLLLPDWEVRLLLVNGESRPRARFPAEDRLEHETHFDVPWMSSTGGGWKRKPTEAELTTLKYREGDLPDGLETRNAEVTVYHMWDESVVGLQSIDPASHTLRFSNPSGHPPGAFGVREYVIWNLREGLTRPGQWYHDRVKGEIVYWPLPGEDPSNLRIVVPTHTTILRLQGDRRRPVRNVTIRGLSFAATTVPLVAGGFAAARFDGAVSLRNAEDCRIENVTVLGVAGQGINSGGGLRNVEVVDSEVGDCGAGGLYVGGTRVTLRNNHVHDIGRSFPSAIGIFRGGRDSLVSNNEVHECTYSAINYGGTGNVIASNLLYHCMTELHDGAAIYMFAATNCVLRGNVARDVPDTGGYGSSAYYLDERSYGSVVEGNLSVRVARPLHMHMATNNIVRNNVFIVDGNARLTFPRCEQFTLEGNVLYATGDIRIENVGAITTWKDNVFHSGTGKFTQVYQENYQNRRTEKGPPPGTVTDDPQFVDWQDGDFGYREGSRALKLGLRPIDSRGAGRK